MTEKIGPNDVLCGRGGATNNHPGNKLFRAIVAEHQNRYLVARKREKAQIAREIVAIVHKNGGRFLKKNNTGDDWEVVPIKKATEKSSQALREGLDVRHNAVRPGKRGNSSNTPTENEKNESNKKRARADTRNVITSPAVVSVTGEVNGVPELNYESTAPSAELKFIQSPLITQAECKNVFGV